MMYTSFGFNNTGGGINDGEINYNSMVVGFLIVCRFPPMFIYLILVTIFAAVDFEASHVEEFESRNNVTIHNSFGIFMLIYSWIVSCLWCIVPISLNDYGDEDVDKDERTSTARDIPQLIIQQNFEDATELLEFGVVITEKMCQKNRVRATLLEEISKVNEMDLYKLKVLKKVVLTKPSLSAKDHLFYESEVSAINGGGLLHMAVAMAFYEKTVDKCIPALKSVLNEQHTDINVIDEHLSLTDNHFIHHLSIGGGVS